MRKFSFLFLFFISETLLAGEAFLKNSNFTTYLTSIHLFQRANPGSYTPIELLPLHKIPDADFEKEINMTSQEWNTLQKNKKGSLADRQREIKLSRDANERLMALVKVLKEKTTIVFAETIKIIPTTMRLAMTPLDSLFWNSILAGKVKDDFKQKNVDTNSVNQVKIDRDKSVLIYSFNDKPELKYKLRLLESGGSQLRLKGEFYESRELSSNDGSKDVSLKTFDLKGGFYNKNTSELPFGPYPTQKDMFTGEDGKSHFAGDGHKHFL